MKALSETKLYRKTATFCHTLCRYQIGHECDISLSLYAAPSTEKPECMHRIKGSGRHNLLLLIALMGGVAILWSMIKALCACCKM